MIDWFRGLDLIGKAGVILLALMIAGIAIGTIKHAIDAAFEGAEQKGAVVERATTQGKVLDHVTKANVAEDRYRNEPGAADADCLLDATNPAEC